MSLLLALALLLPQSAPQQAPIIAQPLTVPTLDYPAEAKSARIQGTVHLEVTIDPTGRVTNVRALDGPIPLRQPAIDAYFHATYRPLTKDGHPTPGVIQTAVVFSLNELPPDTDLLVDRQFAPLHARCQDLSRQKSPEALTVCQNALDLSHRFTPTAQLDSRASAVNDVVLLQLAAKQYAEAATTADEAITLVHATNAPHNQAVATAYISRCEARTLAKQYQGASEDCAVAEETLQTLIADQAAPDQSKIDRTANFRPDLRETLELHAIIMDKLNQPAEARRLRQQAKHT